MNMLRWVFPLSLRQHLSYRFVDHAGRLPTSLNGVYRLALAPIALRALSQTDVAHRQIAWMGFYELRLSKLIARLARQPGGLLVDVGANVGYFSCLWAALNGDNRCVAFEASPRAHDLLRENVASAGLSDRVRISTTAIGKSIGQMNFWLGPIDQTGWGGLTKNVSDENVIVDVTTLDDLLGDTSISVLKIDTEGADGWVLDGARQLLRQHRIKHVFFECNDARMARLGIPPKMPHALLTDCGYSVRPLGKSITNHEYHATIA